MWEKISPEWGFPEVENGTLARKHTHPHRFARPPAYGSLSNLAVMSSMLLSVNSQGRATVDGLCGKGEEPTANSAGGVRVNEGISQFSTCFPNPIRIDLNLWRRFLQTNRNRILISGSPSASLEGGGGV